MSTRPSSKRNRRGDSPTRTPPEPKKRRSKLSRAPPRPPPEKEYHNMPEGYGGVYSVSSHGPFIGTKGCRTCIGVYFETGPDTYFLGHFNTEVRRTTNPDSQDELGSWRIDTDDVTDKDKLFREIHNSTYEGLHNPLPNGPSMRMRRTLIAVCPQSGIKGKKYVGDAMLNGLLSWLQVPKKERKNYLAKVDRSEGFVVEFGKGQPLFFDGEPENWTAVDFAEKEDEDLGLTIISKNGVDAEREDAEGDDVPSDPSVATEVLPEDT
ncbi:hypothetical protein AC578_3805 [Pseudocercospora eumusae]|uniref:Uncharacterized protein n=1 Tax=Pseudocercospora eumusae TaxID=321146 RepID=A0A139HFI8_9PEZI|nr:hypothetical protein AC578_3805 [Pseudocercospora eumusae]